MFSLVGLKGGYHNGKWKSFRSYSSSCIYRIVFQSFWSDICRFGWYYCSSDNRTSWDYGHCARDSRRTRFLPRVYWTHNFTWRRIGACSKKNGGCERTCTYGYAKDECQLPPKSLFSHHGLFRFYCQPSWNSRRRKRYFSPYPYSYRSFCWSYT